MNETISDSLNDSMFSSTNILSTHSVSGEFVARDGCKSGVWASLFAALKRWRHFQQQIEIYV